MYRAWKANPSSVHASWAVYFKAVEAGAAPGAAFTPPPGLQTASSSAPAVAHGGGGGGSGGMDASKDSVRRNLAVAHIIRAFSVRGHEVSRLDPLGLKHRPHTVIPELDYKTYGCFSEADLDAPLPIGGQFGLSGFLGKEGGERGRERAGGGQIAI